MYVLSNLGGTGKKFAENYAPTVIKKLPKVCEQVRNRRKLAQSGHPINRPNNWSKVPEIGPKSLKVEGFRV
jgi:hypothetical protein